MKNKFLSYLDEFHNITVLIPYEYRQDISKSFYLHNGKTKEELIIDKISDIGLYRKYELISYDLININRDYTIYDDNKEISYLKIGAVTRSPLFDILYSYDGNDLGFQYNLNYTIFKLWSPVAKEVEIEIVDLDNNIKFYELENMSKGIWEIKLEGNLDKYKYKYRIRINDTFVETLDPYAISSDANANYNYVIDLKKTYQFLNKKPEFSGIKTDMVVMETHVRDLTSMEGLDVLNPLKFSSLLENLKSKNNNKIGLEYIKELGVTHIQFMPLFDFGGVDEINQKDKYNWGYNPIQYNVVEGSYSTNPNDPYKRINELKKLIDYCHNLGLRVVLDVVYNHVYEMEEFSYQKIVPAYFFHYDQRGIRTNNSGCGNDIASTRKMVRKYIIDSCMYWIKEFNIDGFRFDLMGLLDIETINTIERKAYNFDKSFVIYGEGWNMNSLVPNYLRSNMNNHKLQPYISFFNDSFRDNIRKYAANKFYNMYEISDLIMGMKFYSPSQSINYVECHDNYTLYDYYKVNNLEGNDLINAHILATQITLLSEGIPFIQIGQEFFRTKNLVENSYKSSDDINFVDWNKMDNNYDYQELVKDLIDIRKTYKVFRLDSNSKVKNNVLFLKDISDIHHLHFKLKDILGELYVIIKNNNINYTFLNNENWILIFDGRKKSFSFSNKMNLINPGVYIFLKGGE